MTDRSDPLESAADDSRDLYDVATWEERTSLDGLAVAVHWLLVRSVKAIVVLTALLILLAIFAQIGWGVVTDPVIAVLTVFSALPAFGLAAYVWYSDVTTSEPLSLLVATFALAVLTATFAGVANSLLEPLFAPLGFLGLLLFYFVVVGPVEETVKLLAVRLYAYTDDRFNAVIDGAVYGAVAGLGFATIENLLYIIGDVDPELAIGVGILAAGEGIAGLRALVGPGHVIWSAYAGYYLGLAKFNPEHRGPIVVKGVLVAALIHAVYNSTAGIGAVFIAAVTGIPVIAALVIYILAFHALFGVVLLRKLGRYRDVYRDVHGSPDAAEPREGENTNREGEGPQREHEESKREGESVETADGVEAEPSESER